VVRATPVREWLSSLEDLSMPSPRDPGSGESRTFDTNRPPINNGSTTSPAFTRIEPIPAARVRGGFHPNPMISGMHHARRLPPNSASSEVRSCLSPRFTRERTVSMETP